MWRLQWQSFRAHIPGIGMKRPPVEFEDFATKEEAEAAKSRLPKHEDMVACITPAPPPKEKKKRGGA